MLSNRMFWSKCLLKFPHTLTYQSFSIMQCPSPTHIFTFFEWMKWHWIVNTVIIIMFGTWMDAATERWEEGKWMWGKQRMKINHCYLFMTDLHMWLVHTAYFLKVQTKSGNWCRGCVRGIRSLQWVRDVSGELKCLW